MDITIAIIEDNSAYRRTLSGLISEEGGLRLLGSFNSVHDFMAHFKPLPVDQQPDIVLLDNHLPGIPGSIALPRLIDLLPQSRFVMLTIDDTEMTFKTAVSNGASGYLLKDSNPEEIVATIKATFEGVILFQPSAARLFKEVSVARARLHHFSLTSREIEILSMLRMGLTHKDIGELLCISKHTVDNHCRNIFKKMNVTSAIQAIAKLE